ncbi:hypothetical protein H4Q26_008998 [Puccinia striiformis f. sp. tritici PST-130]|nr:hypothetical protein H4Q26_008998 [Puccinia striiformis f. sp. tritici PST-130]
MNCFQRGHITFALVALIITLHSGHIEANRVVCSYHFNYKGKIPGRTSCRTSPDKDNSCSEDSCATDDKSKILWSALTFHNCDNRNRVRALQYYRRGGYAEVQDFDGTWSHCEFGAFDRNDAVLVFRRRVGKYLLPLPEELLSRRSRAIVHHTDSILAKRAFCTANFENTQSMDAMLAS